jgi:4-diphosphocytidyl-2-C-methyl-D-erythritol kinase
MIAFPNAKINLGLNVLRRRGDGYHDISTVFVPYKGLSDVLEVVYADEPGMFCYGIPCGCEPEKNLCYKAYLLMAERYGIAPVKIYLYKKIPAGSGLGGGSADAAFTLRLINDLYSLGLSDECLAADAATLGSDCAFFIYNRPMLASGRGEILRDCPVSLEGYRVEVTVPPVHVSTAEAYRSVMPAVPEVSIEEIVRRPAEEWRDALVNDFERSILPAHPEIAAAKQAFYDRGAVYASMSGSGSSVFGIFQNL